MRFLLVAILLASTPAMGVTQPTMVKAGDDFGFVSSRPAERAVADVQIRRIKQMISTQKIDPDVAYDRWEKLQDSIRGR